MTSAYPDIPRERDRWILGHRPARRTVDAARPVAFLSEQEPDEAGRLLETATIFLTNRECPWRCLMCDLWKDTLAESVPPGAIVAQINYALGSLAAVHPPRDQLKLYNSGSFFDPRAIPPEDWPGIAARAVRFGRVVVECHPALVGDGVVRFREMLGSARLEVAMGLETAHPAVLERLNKRMTLEQFAGAADFLRRNGIGLRVFILVKPPFLTDEAEAMHWAQRSVDFAFDCGAGAVSLIPTRAGNGALEVLAARGEFTPPRLATLEAAVDYGLGLRRGRVFADLWDLEKFSTCEACFAERLARLGRMNLAQTVLATVGCPMCGEGG